MNDHLSVVPSDDYLTAMLRHADRLAIAHRTEDRSTIAAVLADALNEPALADAPPAWQALIHALAVQVDTDVPWRERFAWTLDIDTRSAA